MDTKMAPLTPEQQERLAAHQDKVDALVAEMRDYGYEVVIVADESASRVGTVRRWAYRRPRVRSAVHRPRIVSTPPRPGVHMTRGLDEVRERHALGERPAAGDVAALLSAVDRLTDALGRERARSRRQMVRHADRERQLARAITSIRSLIRGLDTDSGEVVLEVAESWKRARR